MRGMSRAEERVLGEMKARKRKTWRDTSMWYESPIRRHGNGLVENLLLLLLLNSEREVGEAIDRGSTSF